MASQMLHKVLSTLYHLLLSITLPIPNSYKTFVYFWCVPNYLSTWLLFYKASLSKILPCQLLKFPIIICESWLETFVFQKPLSRFEPTITCTMACMQVTPPTYMCIPHPLTCTYHTLLHVHTTASSSMCMCVCHFHLCTYAYPLRVHYLCAFGLLHAQ